ncbi:MAG TPA: transglycosylase SLT domain-containing protein [Candidatus Binatia bacterium]|nr:transglycosylase SLT domain-containing protein [Candidatus Binatia bacterium]
MKHRRRSLIQFCLSLLLFSFCASPLGANDSARATPSPFPVPAGLESAIEFWKRIFSEYSISQVVYFDPLDLSKIYEVADIGEESRSNEYFNGERARIAATHNVDLERVKVQRGVRERTAAGIKRSGRYIAQVKQIFKERDLPTELTYLPIVESSYDISARSSVGALGIWQFMPRTGRQYLRMGRGIDERKDPLESSRAAAAYLSEAYDRLGSWPLAITSYNYGQAGMARAVDEVGSSNLVDLIAKYNHPNWGFPPKQFYAEFLAAVEIGTNLERYFPGLELDAPAHIKEVEVTRSTPLTTLIRSSGLSHSDFLGWNPALSANIATVPAGYRVKLPTNRSLQPLVVLAKNEPPAPKPRVQVVHHRVKHGETLYDIARRYGASVQRIAQVNGLRRSHLLRVGSTLRIPQL